MSEVMTSQYLSTDEVTGQWDDRVTGRGGTPKAKRDRFARAWKRAQRIRQDSGEALLQRVLVGGAYYYPPAAITELVATLSRN